MKPLTKTLTAIWNWALLEKAAGILLLFLAGASAALGADFWEKKNYREWSQRECAKLLEDSPWSKPLTLTRVEIRDSGRTSSDSQQPYVKYLVQFRSALPVRQAIVRQMQIAQKYDSLTPEQKQQFDKSAEAFLSAGFEDAVLVHVTYESNSQPNMLDLGRYWQSQTTDVLKNYVYITPGKKDKVYLGRYIPAQGAQPEFQFIFPRNVDGQPVLSPNDKNIRLEFTYPVIGGIGDGRGYLEFKVEKMIFEGNIAY